MNATEAPEGFGLGEDFAARAIATYIRARNSVSQCRSVLLSALPEGMIDAFGLDVKMHDALDRFNDGPKTFGAIDDNEFRIYGNESEDEALDEPMPEARRVTRKRFRKYLQHARGYSRGQARATVGRLSDAQADQAIGPLSVTAGATGWWSTIIDYIKNNWMKILGVLLSFLVFLNPSPENAMSMTKHEAATMVASFKSSGGFKASADDVSDDKAALQFAACCNDIEAKAGPIPWGKLGALFAIWYAPGWTLQDIAAKVEATYALFSLPVPTPGPQITAG